MTSLAVAAPPGGGGGGDLAPLRSALRSWSAFDLTGRRPHLDDAAQSLLDAKETSLKARKQLGELTKNLKRAVKIAETDSTPAVLSSLATQCKSTIKSYQEEIDSLTRRCKSAEGSFVQLYHSLHECPDPATILGEALRLAEGRDGQMNNLLKAMEDLNEEVENMKEEKERLEVDLEERERELEEAKKSGNGGGGGVGVGVGDNAPGGALSLAEREELIRLRSEVAEYEVEFRGLKNQDITIRKLETKIEELEQNKEEEIQKELKKAQEELAESEGRRAAEALEREAATARRLESVELQLRAERAGREASAERILRAEDGLGEREAAWEAQRDILVADSERLREELGEAARERDALRLKVEALDTAPSSGGIAGGVTGVPPSSGGVKLAEYLSERRAYDAEIGELSITCNALREELRAKEDSVAEERRSLRATIDALERDRSSLSNKVSSLELRAANAPSRDEVDKMRHELRVLKRLEYNALDFDRDHPEVTPDASGGKDDDLESVLVAKLRRAEADLVRERREKVEGLKERDELRGQLAEMQKSLQDAEGLVASLENDLHLAVATPPATLTVASHGGDVPYGSTDPPDPNTLQTILDPKAPPISNPLPQKKPSASSSSSLTSEKARDDHSVATIVMAQRDRLRARCDALEAERDGFKRELQAQVQASESLKSDNSKLYEKVRYLQSFNAGSGNAVGSAYRRGGSNVSSDRDLDLEALEQRYEASVDPFRQFSRAERQRKFNEMSPMEKIVFIVAKTTLGSKEMRTALFFYVLAMHLLVFVTTYHWSHSSTCGAFHSQDALAHFHGGVPLPETPGGVAAAANAALNAGNISAQGSN